MNEREALRVLAADLAGAGDDAAVVNGTVLTTDMLHEATDFPPGTTRHTAGWRAVGASLSDVAAMGASAVAAVAVYAAPAFEEAELRDFVRGAREVCEAVDAAYVGGDLDHHDEFTTATTAVGTAEEPVYRDGAQPGEVVCVTGTLGRSAAALELFASDPEAANDLFRFTPRVRDGRGLAGLAGAMMDSSDGLARSLHQLAEASGCGFAIDAEALPIDDAVYAVSDDTAGVRERSVFFGEDFELVCTLPRGELEAARRATPSPLSVVGEVTPANEGVTIDGDPLPDRGYTHGEDPAPA